ncbi:WW domain-binding protein 4 [Diplogelasinospora grovesii]|uniref:WW domain-binding protein 4 n=1 Tax=Diplogelasinospora grovesii TaxID=303347 RepID=A0AAN6NAX3_9PEZI|nr:WW domain-binding protein 4 [Diplogelasinospora grovesii]
MSEYWKSTPKYWCKHCQVYVRDTKLERTNHEASGRHQGAIKRSLRDLHRGAEREEKEKERARREVERLNGVVNNTSTTTTTTTTNSSFRSVSNKPRPAGSRFGNDVGSGGGIRTGANNAQVTEAERQKQLEQLADLGVNIPTELRGNMAMAGEWTVTSTRIIKDQEEGGGRGGGAEGRALGVKRELERTEEEMEQEEALRGLLKIKKPRRWGADSKMAVERGDEELEALLSGTIPPPVKKREEKSQPNLEIIKKEEEEESPQQQGDVEEATDAPPPPLIKRESTDGILGEVPDQTQEEDKAGLGGVVVFKKRKPKNIRQK